MDRHHFVHRLSVLSLTSESAGLGQQEGAPGHEEEERRLEQREAVQLGELGNVAVELRTTTTTAVVCGVVRHTSSLHPTP